MHTTACFKIVNKCKVSKFARFKSKDFSSTFKHLICFQALSRALSFYSKFKHFQGFLKHAINPVKRKQVEKLGNCYTGGSQLEKNCP